MQVDNLLIIKQPLGKFLDRNVNIEAVIMVGVKLVHGHFNERFQHLHNNLHIQPQSQDVVLKALVGLDNVACKVKDGQKKIWCKDYEWIFWGKTNTYGCRKIHNWRLCLGANINQGLNSSMMQSICSLKGFVDLGYTHKGPIHPIIQHVFITNINRLVHKFIGWWGGDESSNVQRTLGTLTRRVTWLRRVYRIKDKFQLKLRKRKIQIELSGLKWNLERWVLAARKWQWVHHNPLRPYLKAIALQIRLDLLKKSKVISVK